MVPSASRRLMRSGTCICLSSILCTIFCTIRFRLRWRFSCCRINCTDKLIRNKQIGFFIKTNRMENIKLNIEKAFSVVSKEEVNAFEPKVKAAVEGLEKGTCLGNDFLGWLHLPSSITKEHLADIKATAKVLRDNCEVVIVAGIGGSYLGARAVIEALSNSFQWLLKKQNGPVMIYAGHNIGEDYLYELTNYLKDKKFGVINISKSGTTTETALAFRLLKKQCEDQRGK